MALVIPPPDVLLLLLPPDPEVLKFCELALGAEKYELKSGYADDPEDPFVALVKRLFNMSTAFGATFTLACRSRLDCADAGEDPEDRFEFEFSLFLELCEFISFAIDFSIDVKEPPDIEPYIGPPKRALRFELFDMYCESMLELAVA